MKAIAILMTTVGLFGCDDLLRPAPPPLTPEPSTPGFPDEPDPTDPTGPTDPGFDPDVITITAVEPDEGPTQGGIDVMLRGSGFRDGLEVFFGDAPAPELFVVNHTTAIVRLPPRESGLVDIVAAHPDAEVPGLLPLSFRFFETIVVSAIEPAEGPLDGGLPLIVRGRGFTPDTRFFVGGRPAFDQRRVDAETLMGRSPPGRFGPADVHVVGFNGTGVLDDGFSFVAPPTLTRLGPIAGPSSGGSEVVLEGSGLGPDAIVRFGDLPAEVVSARRDGARLAVKLPEYNGEFISGRAVVDVHVATTWGAATLPGAFAYHDHEAPPDPLVLACSHLVPALGEVGDRVELACAGLAYGGIEVRFGAARAVIDSLDAEAHRLVVVAPEPTLDPSEPTTAGEITAPNPVPVEVRSAAAGWVSAGHFTYRPAAPVAISSMSPGAGPRAGGTPITIRGRGLSPGMSVQIGVGIATSIVVHDATTITAITPPGVAGRADVIVRGSGVEARLPDAFDYTSEELALDLVAPSAAARSGGTWLRVYGEGLSERTEVVIGGVTCEVIARVSSAEIAVRSPRLEVGVHDAELRDGERVARLPGALVVYDPRSGSGGTRGGPIDETLNVTVWGSGGYGPVPGAFVLVGSDPAGPWRGLTDDNGQVTISGPGLYGPVEVTASREGFTAYSVLVFDATNVTVLLAQNPTPPAPGGGGNPVTPLPNATLSGKVYGLDKYVVAPPASCEAKAIAETLHCAACDPAALDGGCDGAEGFSCLEVGDQGPHCVESCLSDAECQPGYACAGTFKGAHCLPSPGIKRAYCNVSSPSLFGYEYPIQASGWVDDSGAWTLDSRRLGELAIYCFGGYQDATGVFTPTVMGVVRHFFAPPSGNISGIAVELSHPLRRSFRLRLQDPPTWPTGLMPPNVAISLDLGPDGVIPFSRALVAVGDHTYVAPRQLASLSHELYNAHYFLYTTLAPAGASGYQPRSYNLVQNVQAIVEDRLPVRDAIGVGGASGWRLEGAQIERDLYGIWAVSDAEAAAGGMRAWAVGEAGTILLFNGAGWTEQASFTDKALRAVSGVSGEDVWAVGDDGAVRHWDGLRWAPIDAPEDDYVAVLAEPDTIWAAGAIRLRRYERRSGQWELAGAPAVQGVRGLLRAADGRLVALASGRVFVSDGGAESAWTAIALPADATLRAGLLRRSGELVLVGDGGTLFSGPDPESLLAVEAPTAVDLMALAEDADGTLVIVGDYGVALRGKELDALTRETIPDYRSRAHGVIISQGSARVVGSAAFILGPFLHFPIVTAPVHEANLESLAFAWTWGGGPENQYTRLMLTPDGSITVWTLIVDGAQRVARLPDLQAAAGLAPLPSGRYRLEVLRVLNRNFDIDEFNTRDFNLYARDSWTTNEAWFFMP